MKRRTFLVACMVGVFAAAFGVGCDNGKGPPTSSAAAPPAPPPADWQTVSHPKYPIKAKIPKDWKATPGQATVIPVDTWELAAPGPNGARVQIFVGWLPRGGRQSSGFPGGLTGEERDVDMIFAGKKIIGTQVGASMRADRDTENLALSVHMAPGEGGDIEVAKQVVAAIEVDDTAPLPPDAVRLRKALDAARAFAKDRGLASPSVVLVSDRTATKTAIFTIFHKGGLVSVDVDLDTDVVSENKK